MPTKRRHKITLLNRVEWLLSFRERDLTSLSEKAWSVLRLNALEQIKETWGIMYVDGEPQGQPSTDELISSQRELVVLLSKLREGQLLETGELKINRVMSLDERTGLIGGAPLWSELAWGEAFMLRVYEDFTDLTKAGYRFRFCRACTKPFVGIGKMTFCTKQHAKQARQAIWRAANRQHLKDERRKAYKRQEADRRGIDVDVVRIRPYKHRDTQPTGKPKTTHHRARLDRPT